LALPLPEMFLQRLFALAFVPQGVASIGRCLGNSMHCAGKTNCRDCEFWTSCFWEISPGRTEGRCEGHSSRCDGEDSCRDCEFWNQCKWVDRASPDHSYCRRYPGKSCVNSNIVNCADGTVEPCREVPCNMPLLRLGHATCGSTNFCLLRSAGTYCDGDYLKQCNTNRQEVALHYCGPNRCVHDLWGKSECGNRRFCSSRRAAWYCDGNLMKRCDGAGQSIETHFCDRGCELENSLRQDRKAWCVPANASGGGGVFIGGAPACSPKFALPVLAALGVMALLL